MNRLMDLLIMYKWVRKSQRPTVCQHFLSLLFDAGIRSSESIFAAEPTGPEDTP